MEITLDQALAQGIEAHKAGKVEEADKIYTAILKVQPRHPDANHNLGILAVGIGKVREALPFLQTAVQAGPKIKQYWQSYIWALIKLNKIDDAKSIFEKGQLNGIDLDKFDKLRHEPVLIKPTNEAVLNYKNPSKDELRLLIDLYNQGKLKRLSNETFLLLKSFPNSEQLYNIEGSSNLRLGMYKEAIASYKKALDIAPDYVEALNNMGAAYHELGKLEEALNAFKQAISIKPDYADAYYNMGRSLYVKQNLPEAVNSYNKTISIKPKYPEAHYNMGNAIKDQGKLEEAIHAYKEAISIKPKYPEAHNNMGNALKDQGKLEEAIHAYKEAISIKPDYVHAWSNGAEIFEKWNKIDDLALWLENAVQNFKAVPPEIRYHQAKFLWRKHKIDQAYEILEVLDPKSFTNVLEREYYSLKAKCMEKLQDFDKAFRCYEYMNSITKKSSTYMKSNPQEYFKVCVDNLNKLKSSQRFNFPASTRNVLEFTPCFLVGFPRSGTTLLDTILRSHSKIVVAEEKPNLFAARKLLKNKGFSDPINQMLPEKFINDARKAFEVEFKKNLDGQKQASVFIDKLPLNILQAPLIQQLYPRAKFILALRHPMDTILSCWMQNFELNSAMANMVDLDQIVKFYCIVMESFKICRTKYNLRVFDIKYEDLVDSFTDETSRRLEFLDLVWEPRIKNYREIAIKRGRINTPSYSQVVQPVYQDAKFRWLKYEKHLGKYTDEIAPWVNEFGY